MYAQTRLSDESLTKYLAFLWVKLVNAGIIHYTRFCLFERSVFSLFLFPKLFYLIAYETTIGLCRTPSIHSLTWDSKKELGTSSTEEYVIILIYFNLFSNLLWTQHFDRKCVSKSAVSYNAEISIWRLCGLWQIAVSWAICFCSQNDVMRYHFKKMKVNIPIWYAHSQATHRKFEYHKWYAEHGLVNTALKTHRRNRLPNNIRVSSCLLSIMKKKYYKGS
jgi:hypothetical protein